MAYEEVTSPIFLDSTGQQIHSDLQQIKNALTTPSAAADITFDNTGTGMQADDVQDAITELKSNLTELSSEIIVISCKTPTAANSEQTIYSDTTLYNNYTLMGYSVNVGTSNIIWGYNNVVKEIMITENDGIRMTVTVSAAANCDMFVFLHKKS